LGGGPFPLNPQYLLSWKEGGHEGRGILDEYDQPSVSIPSIHGSIFMIEALRYAERPVSVACIGPVTNLALAITIAPDIKEKIENVLIMGGCLNPDAPSMWIGDHKLPPESEFNLNADPYAAEIVFREGLQITLTPRETTNKVPTTEPFLSGLSRSKGPLSLTLIELTRIWTEITQKVYAERGVKEPHLSNLRGWMHDPLALIPTIDSDVISVEKRGVRFDYVEGKPRVLPDPGSPIQIDVLVDVDSSRFYDLLLTRLTGLY
jgi:purine nucleosidase